MNPTIYTKDQILSMQPTPNNVLILIDRKQDEYKMSDGNKLYLDCSFQPEQHAPVTGHVVAICKKLIFSARLGDSFSLDWDTDIQLQVGDYVISYYLSAINALSNGRLLTDEYNNQYLVLRYDKLFASRRGDIVRPINGFNLLTPIEGIVQEDLRDRMKNMKLLIPDTVKSGKNSVLARLKYVADPVKRYRDPRYYDFDDKISPDDIIILRRKSNIPLEYAYHASLEGKQVFYRVQRHYMFAKVDESILD